MNQELLIRRLKFVNVIKNNVTDRCNDVDDLLHKILAMKE